QRLAANSVMMPSSTTRAAPSGATRATASARTPTTSCMALLMPRRSAAERKLRQPLAPGCKRALELRPRARRPIQPVGRTAPAPPDNAAVRMAATFERNDVREVGQVSGDVHVRCIGLMVPNLRRERLLAD